MVLSGCIKRTQCHTKPCERSPSCEILLRHEEKQHTFPSNKPQHPGNALSCYKSPRAIHRPRATIATHAQGHWRGKKLHSCGHYSRYRTLGWLCPFHGEQPCCLPSVNKDYGLFNAVDPYCQECLHSCWRFIFPKAKLKHMIEILFDQLTTTNSQYGYIDWLSLAITWNSS